LGFDICFFVIYTRFFFFQTKVHKSLLYVKIIPQMGL